MKGKYLLWKFAFVLLLVALSLWSVLGGNGLKMGPDIAGGYSMIFEVYNEEGRGDLIERVIAVLKKRIDPTGLSSLEWRPLKNDRFEVRMPAASEASQARRSEYLQALDTLLAHNVERSEIRRLLPMDAPARAAQIRELAGKDAERAERLDALLTAMDALSEAERNLQAVDEKIGKTRRPTKQQLAKLQKERNAALQARDAAAMTYRQRWEALRETNVNPREFQAILKLYDEARAQSGSDAKRAAQKTYESRLASYKKQHPAWEEQITLAANRYEDWARVRRDLEDPSDLIRLIRKAGVLEFRIAPWNPRHNGPLTDAQIAELALKLERDGPEALRDEGAEYAWYPIHGDTDGYSTMIFGDYAGRRYLLLSNKPSQRLIQARGDEEAWSLKSASVGYDRWGSPAVDFTFDQTGAKLFSRLTSANKEKQMAILLDDEVYSAPTIQSVISDRGQITGRFTVEEVDELVRTLEAGSLPGRVNPAPVSQNSFSAALGDVAIQQGFRSAIYGLIAVAVFMLIYYLLCGAIADVALLLNIILVLGAMSLFQAVLTLPGVAGVILTIGMAVDANVLIFERLREEQARGLAVRQAIKNAYERAFTAICDANITTLLICLFLFLVFKWVGMEEVRGFAITLGLGVAFSMFTSLVVTRWVFQLLLDGKVVTRPLPMLRLIPKFNVNWMSKRYVFWGVSLVLVAMGVASIVWQGKDLLGIEFSSGTQAMLKLKDDALIADRLPNDALVRRTFNVVTARRAETATDEAHRKTLADLTATARVETVLNDNRVADFLKLYGNDQGVVTLDTWVEDKKNPRFFELIDTNQDGRLDKAELEAKLPETAYQISTTVTDAKLIREIANEAFGKALERRVPCAYDLAEGKELPQVGIRLSSTGTNWITPEMLTGVTAAFRDELLDFEDGLLFVVENVQPTLTVKDLETRIRDIRMQPDFGPWAVNPYTVMPLASAPEGEEGYGRFLVLVRPADPEVLNTDGGRERLVAGEIDVLKNALIREDPIVATNFDAAIAGETAQLAIVVVVMSWLAIVAYLWLRFGSVQWGLAAVICLVHDVVIVIGLVAASGWLHNTVLGPMLGIASFKIDLAMVAAVLTVIGYSVNDTIVVFDRIRENRGKLKTVTGQCINDSINQTLPRTLLTSFTTFLVVFIMYVWGGSGIKAFSYALLMGIVFGTYSSVAVASPLLLGFKQAIVAKVASGDAEPAKT